MIIDKNKRYDAVSTHFHEWRITDKNTNVPPFVISESIRIEVTEFGDAFVYCDVFSGDVTHETEHYPFAMVNNLVYPHMRDELEKKLGLESGFCLSSNLFLEVSPDDAEAIQELFTQRCEDCYGVIEKRNNVIWRFSKHTIRCKNCASALQEKGWSHHDSFYIE